MTILGAAEFAPDRPDLAECTNIANNVVALTPESYGPLPSLETFSSNAVDTTPIGLGFAEDTSLSPHVFSGTPTNLWAINGAANTWTNVSGTTYAAGTEFWRFAQFKNLMLATDYNDPIQSYNMISGGTFSELSSAAPKARYICVAKNFAIVANTSDPVGLVNPARIWWSANGDPTNWPTPGSSSAQSVQSDYNDMLGPQGVITGLAPNLTGCDVAIFFERGVFRMIYSGPPDIFDVYPAAAVKGCPFPNGIVQLGSVVYYPAEDGFYVFDGNYSLPVGANKVDKFFFGLLDPTAFNLVVGAADIANKAIVWIFRTIYATTMAPNVMLIYRWDIQRWSVAYIQANWLARIPIAESGIVPTLVQGQLELGVMTPDNKLSYFAGVPLEAQVGTKAIQIMPNSRTYVQTARPLVQTGSPQGFLLTETGSVLTTELGIGLLTEVGASSGLTVSMSARNNYYDGEVFGPEVAPDISGMCPQRSDGRYHRARVTIAPGIWATMAGVDVVGIKSGLR